MDDLVRAANVAIVIGCLLQAATFLLLLPQLRLWRTTAKDKLAARKEVSQQAESAARQMRMDHHKRVFRERFRRVPGRDDRDLTILSRPAFVPRRCAGNTPVCAAEVSHYYLWYANAPLLLPVVCSGAVNRLLRRKLPSAHVRTALMRSRYVGFHLPQLDPPAGRRPSVALPPGPLSRVASPSSRSPTPAPRS